MTSPPPVGVNRKALLALLLGGVSLFCSCFTAIPAIILGIQGYREVARSGGRQVGRNMAVSGIILAVSGTAMSVILAVMALPYLKEFGVGTSDRSRNVTNLSKITRALLAYADEKGHLPPQALCDKDGRPLLSWRVALLPYLGEKALHDEFHLDESWDSPHNRELVERMPAVYLHPRRKTAPNATHYLALHGQGAAFEGCEGVSLASFTDGKTTILVAESGVGVPWTSPEDLRYQPGQGPPADLRGLFPEHLEVGLATGFVHGVWIDRVSPRTLEAAITRNAGDALGPDW